MSKNKLDVLATLKEREGYLLSGNPKTESLYIDAMLDTSRPIIGLVVPQSFLFSQSFSSIRQKLLSKKSIFGVFDLSSAWFPYTSIKLVLVVVTETQNESIVFSRYMGEQTFQKQREAGVINTGKIGKQIITPEYQDYITKVEEITNSFSNNPQLSIENENYKVWTVEQTELVQDNLSIDYYDPKYRNKEVWESEQTLPLSEIAEILSPRKVKDSGSSLVIKTRDLKYPFNIRKLSKEVATTVAIKRGDILFSSSFAGNNKFLLITDDYDTPLFASDFLKVIRPNSSIESEYLFLYLQSETIKNYIAQHSFGGVFPQLRLRELRSLPVIVPEKITQQKSKELFKTLFKRDKVDIFEAINEQLFDKNTATKPIQKEYLFEELEELRSLKNKIIQQVISDDLIDLKKCIDHKLYKSFIILAGSVLEAFLLDWISESEGKNYFDPETKTPVLYKIIWVKLKDLLGDGTNEEILQMADNIRKKRNLVHPKEYFNSNIKLDDGMCLSIIDDLKKIIKERELNNPV